MDSVDTALTNTDVVLIGSLLHDDVSRVFWIRISIYVGEKRWTLSKHFPRLYIL